jgi:hypothetical protein
MAAHPAPLFLDDNAAEQLERRLHFLASPTATLLLD